MDHERSILDVFNNKKLMLAFTIIVITVITTLFKLFSKKNSSKDTNSTANQSFLKQKSAEFKDYILKEQDNASKSKNKKTVLFNVNVESLMENIEIIKSVIRNLSALNYEPFVVLKITEDENTEIYRKKFDDLITENKIKSHVSNNKVILREYYSAL